MRDLFTALQAIVAGIAITVLLYFFLNKLIHQFSERVKRKV